VDSFSEKSLPAVGGSIGIDRLFEALRFQGKIVTATAANALVINQDETLQPQYLKLVSELRQAGVSSELYYEPAKLEKQFKYAEAKSIPFAVILGADEISKGTVQIKNLRTREQKELLRTELVSQFTTSV
jgi:histidyl-tRNA synthetase